MSWRQISKRYYHVRQAYIRAKRPQTRARLIADMIGWASR